MKMLITAAMAALLAGCAANGEPLTLDQIVPVTVQPDNFCQVSRKVTWSTSDTQETIDQARRHNAKVDRLCGRKHVASS